ncbi:MAG: hypothetical protein MUD10_05140 [Candidatus Pacebacteria bacterium]|nr:hypothetical protein [Candidatus Paceibacterota bacterium]
MNGNFGEMGGGGQPAEMVEGEKSEGIFFELQRSWEGYGQRAKQRFLELMARKREISAKKNEGKEKEEMLTGKVKRFFLDKNFGFIETAKGDVYCHERVLCPHFIEENGQSRRFRFDKTAHIVKMKEDEKGNAAGEVLCDDCAGPEKWELEPTNNVAFGVREHRAVQYAGYGGELRPYDDEIKEVNKEYWEALDKLHLWNAGPSGYRDRFFETFGEPQSFVVEEKHGRKHLKLIYPEPLGEVELEMEGALNLDHWKKSATGNWREGEDGIRAEFGIDGVAGATEFCQVVSTESRLTSDPNFPYLLNNFESLQSEAQEAIIKKVREKIQSPEEAARKRFNERCEWHRIAELREDIVYLRSSGESTIENKASQSVTRDEDVTWGREFVHEWATCDLHVGALKISEAGIPLRGLKQFSVNGHFESAAEVKKTLLETKIKEFKDKIAKIKNDCAYVLERSGKLLGAEWRTQYLGECDKLIADSEKKWKEEDDAKVIDSADRIKTYKERAAEINRTVGDLREEINRRAEFKEKTFTNDYQADNLLEEIKDAERFLNGEAEWEKAEALLAQVKEKIGRYESMADRRRQESERLEPLLMETSRIVEENKGAIPNRLNYDITSKLTSARNIIEKPQHYPEVDDVKRAESLLAEVKETMRQIMAVPNDRKTESVEMDGKEHREREWVKKGKFELSDDDDPVWECEIDGIKYIVDPDAPYGKQPKSRNTVYSFSDTGKTDGLGRHIVKLDDISEGQESGLGEGFGIGGIQITKKRK